MRMGRRVRTALNDALNGDAPSIDPAVRRGLTVLAVAGDDAEERRIDFEERIEKKVDSVVDTVDGLKKLVAGTGATLITTIVVAAGAVISRL